MKKYTRHGLTFLLLLTVHLFSFAQNNIVVFQSDFGLKDGAVSAMKGVAMGVSADLKLFDFNILGVSTNYKGSYLMLIPPILS